jgi:hypothetical protein
MSHLTGDKWLIAMLLYGGGLRLLDALRLRIREFAFRPMGWSAFPRIPRSARLKQPYHAMTTEEFFQGIDLKRITADTELRVRLTALRPAGNTVTIL